MPAPEPRAGLEASFAPARIAVRVNLPSPQRAAELTAVRREAPSEAPADAAQAPLLPRNPPTVPNRPLSYSALAAYGECGYRFYMERVLDLGERVRDLNRIATQTSNAPPGDGDGTTGGNRAEAAARGAAVHSLLEWSQANGWREPDAGLVAEHARAAGLDPASGIVEELPAPIRAWLGSKLLRERIATAGTTVRAEVPLLLGVSGATLLGSIDLLVERDGAAPLVVDYKTDRLDGSSPAERSAKYATQRSVYALAVAEARGASEVEVAYVFLERPDEPVVEQVDAAAMERGREELAATIARIGAGEFPVAPVERRDWDLCRGCPALGRLCSGPL